MRIHSIVLLATVLVFQSCDDHKFVVEGKIEHAKGQILYLEEITGPGTTILDSTILDDSGNFKFKRELHHFTYLKLTINKNSLVQLIADSSEKVKVTGDLDIPQSSMTILGSPQSERLLEFGKSLKPYFLSIDSLEKVYTDGRDQGISNLDSLSRVLQAKYYQIILKRNEFVKGFINKNKGSLVSLSAAQLLDPDKDLEFLQQVDKNISNNYPSLKYVSDFHKKVETLSMQLPVGSEAPDIKATGVDGKEISLSSLRGKIVLIDFWASWCGPCRQEIPNIKKLYDQYKNKGFEIFSFSLDKDDKEWKNAIKQFKMNWTHASDLQEWRSPYVRKYFIEGIPFTCLIDPKGKIIAKGLTSSELENELEKIIK